MATDQWVEISFITPFELADSLADRLIELGSPSVVFEEVPDRASPLPTHHSSLITGSFPYDQSFSGKLSAVRAYIQSLRDLGFKVDPEAFGQTLLDPVVWEERWREKFKPFKVGKRLVITPSWEEYQPHRDEVVLHLDPGLAFGTGIHPSTRLALLLMETCLERERVDSMLDVGSGSGILTLAGLALGVEKGVGVDIDPLAVEVAQENARRNQLHDRAMFLPGSLENVQGSYRLVMANLYLNLLIKMVSDFKRYLDREGRVILSGILVEQAWPMREAIVQAGLTLLESKEAEGWVGMVVVLEG